MSEAAAMHSLTVRFPVPAHDAFAVSAANAAALGVPFWRERIPFPAAHPTAAALRRREARRPLHGGQRLRMLVLEYDCGAADLILVARRSDLTEARLRALPTTPVTPETAGAVEPAAPLPRPAAGAADQRTEWGLGLRGSTRHGEVEIPLSRNLPPPAEQDLPAAVRRCASAHSGAADPRLVILTAEAVPDSAADTGTAVGIGVHCDTAGDAASEYDPFLAPPLPLVVQWRRAADGTVSGTVRYRERDVSPQIARDFAAHLAHVLAARADRPEAAFADLDVVSAAEALRLVQATPAPDVAHTPVHTAFSAVARSTPDAVALTGEKSELTYAELDERSARMARGLSALGVLPGEFVAVGMERGPEFVVVLLAILKAGAAYAPVDPRYPADRIRYTVQDCAARLLLGEPDALPRLPGVRVLAPESVLDAADGAAGDPAAAQAPIVPAQAPAYVIYTSGSTGRPKGVLVPHRNVSALVAGTRGGFGLRPGEVWSFFHSTAFDFSVWEIWGCLLTGGRLVVVPSWAARDTELFYDLVARERVTVLSQTPSAFAHFVASDTRRAADLAVRLVVLGGEALATGILAPWFARHSAAECQVSNMFGITETTVHVTDHAITPHDVAAGGRRVGRPLPGWSVSVRDERGRVRPAGAAGEIWVGGAGLAIGYLNRPGLTAERFVADELTGQRLYRSGDLGRIRPDGTLDHLGRADGQVKIRGHRIELDEIRGALLTHPAVGSAAVVLRLAVEDDRDTARLDAYYVPVNGVPAPTRTELADHLALSLPEYMLPATLTRLDAIALTVNGKADLAALPAPASPARAAACSPAKSATVDPTTAELRPGDPVTAAVLSAWTRLLRVEAGIDDNFFLIGGNSLMVVRLLRELADEGLPRLSVQEFYRNSDARSLITLLRERRS
jgi:amino acid adenylation domain-containing protein